MSFFSKVFAIKPGKRTNGPAEVYAGLRQMILTKRLPNLKTDGLWAVVMDIGAPNGTATIVAVADGTVSLYTSTGGGIIGLGPHEGARRAASSLLESAFKFVGFCQTTTEYPLPSSGNVRFYLVGSDATVTAEANSTDLGRGTHVLSPLYCKCQELVTEIRKVDEKLKAKVVTSSSQVQ